MSQTSSNSIRYKSVALTANDINKLVLAEHVFLQALFVSGRRPRAKLTLFSNEEKYEVVAGSSIHFLSPRLKEPRVECHCMICNCCYNSSWVTFISLLQPYDEIELIWLPDSHVTPNMLQNGTCADSIIIRLHRNENSVSLLLSVIVTDFVHKRPIKLSLTPTLEEIKQNDQN